jgi:H+/Cl- antiporter ClcA
MGDKQEDPIPKKKDHDLGLVTDGHDHLVAQNHDGLRFMVLWNGDKSKGGEKVDLVTFLYKWRGSAVVFSFTWTLFTAIVVGFIEWVPAAVSAVLLDQKFDVIDEVIEKHGLLSTLGVNLGFGLLFGGVATLACYFGGYGVSGSGLPDLLSYAACGYTIKDVFSVKVIAWKLLSVTLAVCAGTSVGREGPSIFLGAAAAYVVGKFLNQKFYTLVQEYPRLESTLSHLSVGKFDTPHSGEFMHEIVMIGASAGFACAFGAPIGGSLFVYEEVASHWTQHQQMTSRVVFGVGVAVAFLNILNNALGDTHGWDALYHSIVIYDDRYFNIDSSWHYGDVGFFFIMAVYIGITCGIMSRGAMFCTNFYKSVKSEELKMLLYIITIIFTVCTFTVIPFQNSPCKDMPSEDYLNHVTGLRRFVRYGSCPEGTYNEMASLTLSSAEDSIKHLFSRDAYTFSLSVLFPYTILYSISFAIVMGAFVAAGNFTPNVLIGAATGRIFGEIAALTGGKVSHPGVYAIIGATCQLVSWTRAIPAIIVTIFEVTSDTSLVVPMLLASMLSRSLTNLFGMDGWTHANLHASANLPHHRIRPQHWPNMDTMPAEERVAHPPSLHKLEKAGDSLESDSSERYTYSNGKRPSALVIFPDGRSSQSAAPFHHDGDDVSGGTL